MLMVYSRKQKLRRKYFTISDNNKFTSEILDTKIKETKLVNKSATSSLAKNSKLWMHDLSYFLGKNVFDDF